MQELIKNAVQERNFSEDATILAKADAVIRKDMFDQEGFKFSGSFSDGCQQRSAPASLISLVAMLLNGVNIENTCAQESQPCLTVAQAILFNAKVEPAKKCKTGQTRHTKLREPPLPLYIGFTVHAMTRSKSLITKLYQLGVSVAYQRIVELEDMIASSVSERFVNDGVVAPACLRKGVFTVGALDNLDHNPSSKTAASSFHGTGINTSKAVVPGCRMEEPESCISEEKKKEDQWAEYSSSKLTDDSVTSEDTLTWAAYHASDSLEEHPPAVTALLPLFYEKAATPAMVKHGMDVLKHAITFLNPDQIPVITVDQPLFALAKMVQWKWPASHGEQAYVVMMGGLHIEMALWSVVGDLLDGSGCTAAITESNVASSGEADSFLRVTRLTRTRHAHQVTVLALQKLKSEAFSHSGDQLTTAEWDETIKSSPTFRFWNAILHYQMLVLLVVRAQRQRNFVLYVEALEELVPLFFVLDHVNYARWTPIHIRDMKSLPQSITEKFQDEGQFVLSRTGNDFSAMPFDQAHEQENKIVKSAGGAVGLTENPTAFRRWMLSGPETTRLLQQFIGQYLDDTDSETGDRTNHETGLNSQKTFKIQVNNLIDVIRKMGNPFLDNFPELVTLDSRDCMGNEVAETIVNLDALGKSQYSSFLKDVIKDRTVAIGKSLKQNKLPLFRKQASRNKSKQSKTISLLQNNVALFAQLYIAMQSRDADLREFFSHEVQPFPPSLSEFGNLRLPTAKSDLLRCLSQPSQPEPPTEVDCKVCDWAVIVHCLPVTRVMTFDDYAENVFLQYIRKEATREKRGTGLRRKAEGRTKIPPKWMEFLRGPRNKQELFQFLSVKVAEFPWFTVRKEVYITSVISITLPRESPKQLAASDKSDPKGDLDRLQKLQNRAARVITSESYEVRSVEILDRLGWDNPATRRFNHEMILIFKIMNGLTPKYLGSRFDIRANTCDYDLRDKDTKIILPLPKTQFSRKNSKYRCAAGWNSLPMELRNAQSLPNFKKGLCSLPLLIYYYIKHLY
ncbi:predicted protein [Nematostella vectensis]|uniref:Uncharacterized protein n=1 Tax=Nematostella vectensis TaxID=45351 RepID=A7S1Z3_NEMVE|nr:predicted protein [Nematostella vectensis]|eukprot:XP_001634388.1 predicted protein [Nematostella vectensis]